MGKVGYMGHDGLLFFEAGLHFFLYLLCEGKEAFLRVKGIMCRLGRGIFIFRGIFRGIFVMEGTYPHARGCLQ